MKEKIKWKYIIFSLGILLTMVGVQQGEVQKVAQKAIHICLECIGIG